MSATTLTLPDIREGGSQTSPTRDQDARGGSDRTSRSPSTLLKKQSFGDLSGSTLGPFGVQRRVSSTARGIMAEGRRLSVRPTDFRVTPEEVKVMDQQSAGILIQLITDSAHILADVLQEVDLM